MTNAAPLYDGQISLYDLRISPLPGINNLQARFGH